MEIKMKVIVVLLVNFIIALILGRIFLPILRRLKAGQSIREDGPKSHLKKSGTPTMGGLIFLITILITTLIFTNFKLSVFMLLFATFAFAGVGFIDDYIKVVKKTILVNLSLPLYVWVIIPERQ